MNKGYGRTDAENVKTKIILTKKISTDYINAPFFRTIFKSLYEL